MAMNKFMHPRNIYKDPPDFVKLAQSYEEFANIAKTDVTGKVQLDFKDPHALRVLTKCLLKSDFNLDVEIPDDRLVPTLPLRLNYILWLEDLLKSIQRTNEVWGIDIGTGACAIYPMLASTKNKWHMFGTETDTISFAKAQENINKNNLQGLVKLTITSSSTVIGDVLNEKSEQTFDFCMCNPPFYSSMQELYESRSPARLPPKNGFTGSPQELITEGGELEFCRRLIAESKEKKDRVLIFTTMVGHKYNMKELELDLQADGIPYTTTEFCQGRVTRWGLAWTYQSYNLYKLVPPRIKTQKKSMPIVFAVPEVPNLTYDVNTVINKIKCILEDLKITYKVIHRRGHNVLMDVIAHENTWSNQRRKRRLIKQNEEKEVKKIKSSLQDVQETDTPKNEEPLTLTRAKTSSNNNNNGSLNSDNSEQATLSPFTQESNTTETLVHSFFKILRKDNNILLEMEFIDGTIGKEGLHQIVQYIKNHWK